MSRRLFNNDQGVSVAVIAAATFLIIALIIFFGSLSGSSENPPPNNQGSGPTTSETTPPPSGGTTVAQPPPATSCSSESTITDPGQFAAKATTGATVCIGGGFDTTKLTIKTPGVIVLGQGMPKVQGIDVEADNVTVDGFDVEGAKAPGIYLAGNGITVSHNKVEHPTGGDFDGIRFFGANIKILGNTIDHITNTNGAHADCMQTFATGGKAIASQHVQIDGNRCQDIDNQCLIAEGPNSEAGDGSGQGETSDIAFTNNYCQARASQALMIDDVQGLIVNGNTFDGGVSHAIALQNKSTGARIGDNVYTGIKCQVGMDSSSKTDYQGPKSTCAP